MNVHWTRTAQGHLLAIHEYIAQVSRKEVGLPQVSARFSEQLVEQIDAAARILKRSRAEVIRQAVQYYIEDLEDLRLGLERLQDPADPVLDWEEVKRDLLRQD